MSLRHDLAALLFLLAFFFFIPQAVAAAEKGVVTAETSLNVRKEASISSERIGALTPGATITITGTKGDFYEIVFQGKRGYVHRDYVRLISASTNEITIYVNGERLKLPISKVPLEQNSVLVPFRAIGEALGIDVRWIGKTRQVHAKDGNVEVVFTLNDPKTVVNGNVIDVTPPPRTIEQRTVIPLRFFAETFGADVRWDQAKREVHINREKAASPKPSGTYVGVVTRTDTLNVRTGPGQTYPALGKLSRGERVSVDSFSDRWAKISYNGKTAYVHSYYLDLTKNGQAFRLIGKPKMITSGNTTTVTWQKIGGAISSSHKQQGQTLTITTTATEIERLSQSIKGISSIAYNGAVMTLTLETGVIATVEHTTGELTIVVSEKRTGGSAPLRDKVIVIDAGHGGNDPGAIGNGLNEKDIVLDVALRVEKLLQQSGARVVMTRSSDTYPTLTERVKLAHDVGADVFISIHINAAASPAAHGTETYWNATYASTESRRLAEAIHQRLIEKLGTRDRGVKQGNFQVIRTTKMPSVLLELAFITNAEDAALLKSDSFRQRSAEAIYEGLADYYK